MTDDLDARLRRLVHEVGDASPDVEAVDLLTRPAPRPDSSRMRPVASAVAAAVVIVVGWFVLRSGPSTIDTDPIDETPAPVVTSTTSTTTTSTIATLAVADEAIDALADEVSAATAVEEFEELFPRLDQLLTASGLTDAQAVRLAELRIDLQLRWTAAIGAVAEARAALDRALTQGEWGPQLDTFPADSAIAVDFEVGLAWVTPLGERLGWTRGSLSHIDRRSVDRTTELLSLEDGTACASSSGLLICAHPLFDSPFAEIRRPLDDGTTGFVAGPAWGPFPEAPEGMEIIGSWRWVESREDGEAILGQWSAECEVPSAYVIVDDVILAVVLDEEGDLAVMSSEAATDADLDRPASWALGWAADGRAIVHVATGPCSSGNVNAVVAVDTDGGLEVLVETSRPLVWVGPEP